MGKHSADAQGPLVPDILKIKGGVLILMPILYFEKWGLAESWQGKKSLMHGFASNHKMAAFQSI